MLSGESERSLFNYAMVEIFEHEGGLCDHPKDPGGLTNLGICLRAYPKLGREGIINMTKEKASELYWKDYWKRTIQPWMYEAFPCTCIMLIDCAVNQGVSAAIKLFQQAVGATADGVIGNITKRKALGFSDAALCDSVCALRALRYANTKNRDTFLRGWFNRLMSVHRWSIMYNATAYDS